MPPSVAAYDILRQEAGRLVSKNEREEDADIRPPQVQSRACAAGGGLGAPMGAGERHGRVWGGCEHFDDEEEKYIKFEYLQPRALQLEVYHGCYW